jgi:hypothetical protein
MTRADRAAVLEAWADSVDSSDLTEADRAVARTIADLAAARLRIEEELLNQVRSARSQGRSWSQIGAMLGVSKQAAQRKYADRM